MNVETVVIEEELAEVDEDIQIDITQLEVGETLILENIYFLPGRHFVREESLPELKKLLKILQEHEEIKIEIQGHICCHPGTGDGYDFDTKENKLSINRAKYIYDYLIRWGIDKNRLRYKGFGRTKPLILPEITVDDENKNRRVEIMIIE
ncbi:MAG: OmpA family protein [Bacteroidetes bacterium]|nr:OmpA family protein [Bacteroidota bacterium]